MKTIQLSEVAALTPHVQSGCDEPLVLMHEGKAVAAIVPADERDVEDMLLSINPQFNAILGRSQQRLEREGGLTPAEMRRRLNLPAT
jgi:antitoxin (DNA-binding transcriptional repressor) of toxin-antitoxin stability system